ncbi:metal dependent phosphohydrolase [Xylariales sp. AK1849]|nr:metal dependent phosphohydrolase [Xylariales sp. AK1849]
MSSSSLPDLPQIGLTFPYSPLAAKALEYTKQHTSELVYNHTVRSAYWALILVNKLPQFADVSLETVVLSCILHEMGWATTKDLITKDRRFEVDGADIARKWLLEQAASSDEWDVHRIQLMWDSIALHITSPIALYKEPEVALTNLGIFVDFCGPNFPGGAITLEEFKEVVRVFPRAGFEAEGIKNVMRGLCKDETETTFDNVVAEFGLRFGFDGKGGGRDEYERKWTSYLAVWNILRRLLEQLRSSDMRGFVNRRMN